jgi:hypothetical protein
MIKYRLICDAAHEFEGWFQNSGAFDSQHAAGHIACPTCGSADVSKAIMAPSIATRSNRACEHDAKGATRHAYVPPAIAQIARRLRAEIEKTADYVGPRFAEEARRIHYEESPERGIYGEATLDEVAELDAEGIEAFPLPVLPEEHN